MSVIEGESMKRSWTALAVSLFALGILAGCNDYNNSVQYNTGATITNISPSGMPSGSAPSTAAQCQNTTNGPTFPCFTLYVIASANNPFSTTGTPPVVQWNGQKIPTTLIDSTNISAQVPYSYLSSPGSVAVNVFQPQSGGKQYNGLSNALTFLIYGAPNPVPTLSAITPTSAGYCDPSSAKCANVPITLTGTGFIPVTQNGGSSATFTGLATYGQETAITVTSISTTQIQATIPGSLLCASDNAQINVLNPPSAICLINCPNLGGGDTNNPPNGDPVTTQIFTVSNATTINSCPANVAPGTAAAMETAAISQDGRYVAYASSQNGTSQILLRDTCLGAGKDCIVGTRTISVASDGSAGNADSSNVTITPDGRYVAFSSTASNLVENAPLGRQVYLRDTCNGVSASCRPATQVVSVDESGRLSGMASVHPSVSASGRFVAFVAEAPARASATASAANASAGSSATKTVKQIFVRDTCVGASNCSPKTTSVSSSVAGTVLVAEETPSISQDGRYIVYTSAQSGGWQIVLSDTCLGAGHGCAPSSRTISAAADGSAGNAASHNAVMTPDGRYIAFSSAATNLLENGPLGRQVYLRDTCAGTAAGCAANTTLISTDETGKLSGTEAILPSLSSNGRYIAFLAVNVSQAGSANVAPNSGQRQVFVRDTCLGTANCSPKSTRISLQPGYVPVDSEKPAGPALAGLGKQVALSDGKSSTVFTPTVAVDEHVLLAIPSETN
jgi:Tol biopolymer transport system component